MRTWAIPHLVLIFALTVASLSTAVTQAAEIRERPELASRLAALRAIYPPVCPNTKLDPDFGCVRSDDQMWPAQQIWERSVGGIEPRIVSLSGVIEPGDAERIRAILDRDDDNTPVLVLVLDSPGGNFAEGLKIGALLQEHQRLSEESIPMVLAYVLNGSVCHSACAMAFALNANNSGGDAGRRFIEEGAVVGFHMPYIGQDMANVELKAGEALELAYDAVMGINQLVMGRANPPSLLQKVMAHRTPDDLFEVHADIDAWRFGFVPVAAGGRARIIRGTDVGIAHVRQACQILAASVVHFGGEGAAPYFPFDDGPGSTQSLLDELGEDARFTLIGDIWHCDVHVTRDAVALSALPETGDCLNGPEAARPGFPDWCLTAQTNEDGYLHFRADSSFARLTAGFLADALGCLADGRLAWLSDDFQRPETSVGYTSRAANLRAAPTVDSDVVAQLPPDTAVELRGCRITDDTQAVWFQVSTEDGPGWLSSRLVKGQPDNPMVFEATDF